MGKGIFNGILQGYIQQQDLSLRKQAADRQSENDKVEREFRQEQVSEARRKRDLDTSRRSDLTASLMPPNTGAEGSASQAPRPFEAMENAANKRLGAGDLDGYNDLIGKSAAAKTLHYTTKVQNAYRTGDVNSALEVLNEFPNGVKYAVQAEPGGKLLGRAVAADGREVGQTAFNSTDEFFAFVQDKMDPGDIRARIRADAEGRTKAMLAKAKADQDAAQAENYRAQAGKNRAETETEQATRTGKLGKLAADIRQSNASAAASYASAANAGTTSEMRNFGFTKNMNPEQREAFYYGRKGGVGDQTTTDPTVLSAQKALIDAYTDPLKRSTLNPEQLSMTSDLISGARGQSLVRKSSVGKPQVVSPSSQDPYAEARNAINKGASKEAVLKRLVDMGIDPKGL